MSLTFLTNAKGLGLDLILSLIRSPAAYFTNLKYSVSFVLVPSLGSSSGKTPLPNSFNRLQRGRLEAQVEPKRSLAARGRSIFPAAPRTGTETEKTLCQIILRYYKSNMKFILFSATKSRHIVFTYASISSTYAPGTNARIMS